MGDFFDLEWDMPDYDLGGLDTSWTDFQVPDYSMDYDFYQPVYSDAELGGDWGFSGYEMYLPDFTLGGGEGDYNLYGGEPSSILSGNSWRGLEDDYARMSQEYGGFEQASAGGVMYDPSTGVAFDRAGNPITPQGGGPTTGGGTAGAALGSEVDPEEFMRRGGASPYSSGSGYAGVTPDAPGGSAWDKFKTFMVGAAPVVGGAAGAAGRGGGGTGGGGGGTGGGGGGLLGGINDAISSPLGGILAKLGIGAASMGVGRLLAGDAPKAPDLRLPPQSATGQATEGALLDALNAGGRADLTRAAGNSIGGQADLSALLRQIVNQEQATESQMQPGYETARMKALGLIPGQLDTSMDPVQAALQDELMKTMSGPLTGNPLVEDQIRKDWAAMQNQMFKRLGPDWELSSAGQESKQAFDRSAEQRRYQSRSDTIRSLQPLQQSQMQATGGERRSNLGALAGAANLGRGDIYRTGTQMNTIAPVGAYLGGDPDRFRSMQANLETQSALLPYQQANKEREQTMAGVGQIGGTIAGSIGGRRLTDYVV
jgi:hypothetical protein